MLCSTALFYLTAISIEAGHAKKLNYLKTALLAQLLILFFFKAADPWLFPLTNCLSHFLPQISSLSLNFLMPIGISYYTFKLIGYLLDVYWQKIPAEKEFIAFANYISFFPQIVSGPIQRSEDFLPQIKNLRKVEERLFAGGCRLILFGFFKKLVVADNLAFYVNNMTTWEPCLVGLFSNYFVIFQIYADFSAITDIAIGLGRLFGIESPKNFDSPFYASNIQDFWRRWHMSLTSWLRDYLFLPLQLKLRNLEEGGLYLSIFINMVAIGLWHGFSWNFFIFGLIHSCYMIVSVKTLKVRDNFFRRYEFLSLIRKIAAPVMTFHIVLISFIFFRFNRIADILIIFKNTTAMLKNISGKMGPELIRLYFETRFGFVPQDYFKIFSALAIMEAIHLVQSSKSLRPLFDSSTIWMRWAVYWILILYIIAFGNYDNLSFIYSGF